MLAIPETFALKTFAWKLRLWKFDQSFWPVGQIISWLFIHNAVIVYGYGCFLSSSIERNAFLWAQVRTHRAFTRIRAIISRLSELSTPHRENLSNEILYISTHLFGINLSESIKCTSCKNKRTSSFLPLNKRFFMVVLFYFILSHAYISFWFYCFEFSFFFFFNN